MILGDAPFFVTHFMPIAKGAQAQGLDIHVATPLDEGSGRDDLGAAAKIRDAGFTFHRISLNRAGANPLAELLLIRELSDLIGRLSPDVVHCFGLKPILYAGAIARIRRIGAVCAVIGLGLPFMAQGPRAKLQQGLLRAALAFVFSNPKCRVTVENEEDGAVVLSTKAIHADRMVRLNGAGVNLAAFRPRGNVTATGAPVIMFAARLIAPKGVYDLIEAARRIKARGILARFVFQCQLDLRNRQAISEEDVKAWHKEGVIEWWGPTTNMPDALKQADIFCLPTYYREGLPKVLLEAAATGLPIVTSDLAGCRDVVLDGQNGFLVPPRNVEALEAALMNLIGDPALRWRAGARSREIAVERFSVDRLVETSLGIYASILDTGATASPLKECAGGT